MNEAAPNIVLFMVDQLTAFALKTYGGTVTKTPHLDGLAARGVVFEDAYCNYPLCAPARFSMMAGRLPSRIGAFDNGSEFTASTPTFAHYLRGLGYYTCISGKMHFMGPDQHHGFEERLTTEIYPSDFSWTPAESYADPAAEDEGRFAAGVSTVETVLDAGPMARTMQIDYDEDVTHNAVREIYARARSEDRRPFMMTISLTHPHDPYVITREHWDRYRDDEIDDPRVDFVPLDERDPQSRALHFHYGLDKTDITPEICRRARHGYYGMISYVDDLFGRVMAALEAAGFGENTVVIFTSDHGDMIGERGMWFKKTLFEPAIRVPLIIARPNLGARRVSGSVSLVDLLPTLVELAGAPADTITTPVDGRSLVPALTSGVMSGPVFVEHIDGGTVGPRVMVRDGAMKFVYSPAYPEQLYDLSSDPDERNNLAGTGEASEAEKHLRALVMETWDLDALAEQVRDDHADRRVVNAALGMGRAETWEFKPPSSSENERYVRRGDAFPVVERRNYLPYGGR
ncbi:MAG: choline-sulfatase [Alphaproteobacteria bacterium]